VVIAALAAIQLGTLPSDLSAQRLRDLQGRRDEIKERLERAKKKLEEAKKRREEEGNERQEEEERPKEDTMPTGSTTLVAKAFAIRGGETEDFRFDVDRPSVVTAEVTWRGLVRELQVSLVGRNGTQLGRTSPQRRSTDPGKGTLRVELSATQLADAGPSMTVRVANTSRATALGRIAISATPLGPLPPDEPGVPVIVVDDPSIKELTLRTHKPLRQGSLRSLGNAQVSVGPDTTRMLKQVVQGVVAEHRVLADELRSAMRRPGVLLKTPTTETQVIEFADAYVVSWSTKIVVIDPTELARRSPTFREYLGNRQRVRISVAELEKESRDGLRAFMSNVVPKLPANDPIRKAADSGGEEAVLQAIVEGKGKLEIVDELTVPKTTIKPINGRLQIPAEKGGLISHQTLRPATNAAFRPIETNLEIPPPDISLDAGIQVELDRKTEFTQATGKHTFRADFLMGFTQGDSWHWERRWNYWSGFFRITLGAGYGLGLRVPLQFRGEASPTNVLVVAEKDQPVDFKTKFAVRAINANAQFYRNAGLGSGHIFQGNEVVLEGYLLFGYRFRALWMNLAHEKNTKHGLDWSGDFTPSLGKRTDERVKIPASDIGTEVNLVVIKGGVDIGLHFEMDGEVRLAFEQFTGKQVARLLPVRVLGPDPKTYTGQLAPLPNPGSTSYGFRLHSPKYQMGLTMTPELNAKVKVGYKSISHTFSTGWIPLNVLETDLGKVTLSTHAGTRRSYEFTGGRKEFERPQ